MPNTLSLLEVETLEYLKHHDHAVPLHRVREQVAPGNEGSTIEAILRLKEKGYVEFSSLGDIADSKLVRITPAGEAAFEALAGLAQQKAE